MNGINRPVPLTTVYISRPRGQYATNVDACSSHDAVRKAVAFFHDPFWKGPKPKAGTVCGCARWEARKLAGTPRPNSCAAPLSDYCLSDTVTDGSVLAFGPRFMVVMVLTLPSGEILIVPVLVTTPLRLKVVAMV